MHKIEKEYQIGIFGTFDLENFGDLLFPLIAEVELSKRMGGVKIRPFSYYAKTDQNWPYTVTSLTDLPNCITELDGALLGGGHIIRFDKHIAPGYKPSDASIHHPTGYWLAPSLIALEHGIPLAWNAPGINENDEFPTWAEPLLRIVIQESQYISIRDAASRKILAPDTDKKNVAIVPDTAFGLNKVIDPLRPSPDFSRLCSQLGITRPYIIFQATETVLPLLDFIEKHIESFSGYDFLALPIGPVLGDQNSVLRNKLPNLLLTDTWPHPLQVAELISQSEAVFGHSYHLAIAALTFGVPVFSTIDSETNKQRALSDFKTIYRIPTEFASPNWFISKFGKTTPDIELSIRLEKLEQHWDTIADIFLKGRVNTLSAVSSFLQSLPSHLEDMFTENLSRHAEQENLRNELGNLRNALKIIYNSRSWKVTSPFRALMLHLRNLVK